MAEDREPLRLRLNDGYRDSISFHRWFAMRGTSAARAAIAFTTSPEWLINPGKIALLTDGDDATIASAIIQGSSDRTPGNLGSNGAVPDVRLLDMCAGTGTVAAMAARLGFNAMSVELSIVPHLIDRVLHDFAVSLTKDSSSSPRVNEGTGDDWRGFAREVEDFAWAVWRNAKERLKEVFEEEVDIRVWIRIAPCPSCGRQAPVLSNVRLSRDTAVTVSADTCLGDDSEYPHFGLLQADFLDQKGTYEKGICTCPFCHFQFRFQGYELIPLRSVPVAVRMRDSNVLRTIDSPGTYVKNVNAAAYRTLATSSQNLGKNIVLAARQSMFHDSRGEPVSVGHALLPRQRAYFAALAESMGKESATLARRAALTSEHRFAIRSAVGLLISAQIDYVNTYTHWLVDTPRPSTFAGPLRLSGVFTEVGGAWLERFWQSRLHHLLDLIRQNSSSPRPVRAIRADATDIPLGDSTVSAIVWDPPYYDNVDYDTFGEPYQVLLSAMTPDLVSELLVPPRMTRQERTERYEQDLLRQAHEARRIVGPQGSIGVFWLERKPGELDHFLEMMRSADLQLLRAVRLDTIRARRGADIGAATYLVVLRPVPAAASAVPVDAEKVLALATVGALSLYDGLAELLESAWGPIELARIVPEEFHGSARQRIVGFVASHPEPEQLLVELGRMTLARELVNRDVNSDELGELDAKGLAQQLLAQFGFAVARPIRFSIHAALSECGKIQSRLELAESVEAIRGAFFTCCDQVQQILRYASLAWGHLAYRTDWNEAFRQIISSGTAKRNYPGPDKLTFGQHELLFTTLPATLAESDQALEKPLFAKISRAIKKGKVHEKLSALIAMRNDVEHNNEPIISMTPAQLRQRCCIAAADACAALEQLDSQHVLPLTVSPDEERRDRYGRRILRLLAPDGIALEAFVGSETDLTEPFIYFASSSGRRDIDPKLIRAKIIEDLLGIT